MHRNSQTVCVMLNTLVVVRERKYSDVEENLQYECVPSKGSRKLKKVYQYILFIPLKANTVDCVSIFKNGTMENKEILAYSGKLRSYAEAEDIFEALREANPTLNSPVRSELAEQLPAE